MLRAILDLFRERPGATLTAGAIAAALGAEQDLVEHMLGTLVRHGRLIPLENGAACEACPLSRICAGGLTTGERCYGVAIRPGV